MTTRMREDWYRLLRSVHYLGYHTEPAMSYGFDYARPFSLVTSNKQEVMMAQGLLKAEGAMQAAIWVIEGDHAGRDTRYFLREVFHPRDIKPAHPEDHPGARKKYEWLLTGHGQAFGRKLPLDDLPWFPEFRDDNGNFGFGLRILRDPDVKERFLEMARPFYAYAPTGV